MFLPQLLKHSEKISECRTTIAIQIRHSSYMCVNSALTLIVTDFRSGKRKEEETAGEGIVNNPVTQKQSGRHFFRLLIDRVLNLHI